MSQHCKTCGVSLDVHDAVADECKAQSAKIFTVAESDFDAVALFHRKFGLPIAGETDGPHVIARDVAAFRWRFLMEEMTELLEAMNRDDLPEIADALVDLVYVALGTAHYYGLPWPALFAEVQRTNMLKERAAPDGSNSKRSSALDIVKPEGWRPPELAPILEVAGWKKP